jgi:YVTN family beta-propeller protein
VVVVDAQTHTRLDAIKLAGESIRPMGIVASRDGQKIYVTTGRGRRVVTIDTRTNEPVGSVEVGPRPWGIALSGDERTLYTANGPSNDVAIVDIASGTVTAHIPVGEGPWGLALVP